MMNPELSPHASLPLEDWITPSALQESADLDAASYWGSLKNNLEPHFGMTYTDDATSLFSSSPNPSPPSASSSSLKFGSGNKSTISMSPMFPPMPAGRPPPDFILLSFDSIIFYVDEATLYKASNNGFNGLLPLQAKDNLNRLVYIPKLFSTELQVMLQVIYDLPSDSRNPGIISRSPTNQSDVQTVVYGISLLPQYGVAPRVCIQPHTNMFRYLLTCAPMYPLEMYALASSYGMEELAVSASSHLLAVDLNTISPVMAGRIGPVYLKRLFEMLEKRKSHLKNLLSTEPALHNPTSQCGFSSQQVLKQAWNHAASLLTWNLNAGIATSVIKEAIIEATSSITCPDCIKARDTRLRTVCQEWSMAARTI